ncbi:MAG: ECF-type sigma factor [Acidobacteriota bacterium]
MHDLTELLHDWSAGDAEARDRLIAEVYPQLRKLAGHLKNQRPGNVSIQTTEIVHEAYFKLIDQRRVSWKDRAHFFAVTARLLRRLIVDQQRHRRRAKRGGGIDHVAVDPGGEVPGLVELAVCDQGQDLDVLALDRALHELTEVDEVAGQVVELRYFGGLDHDETAEVLGIGRATVGRRWRFARAWLRSRLEPTPSLDPPPAPSVD